MLRNIWPAIMILQALPVSAQRLTAPTQSVMTDGAFLANSIPKWEHGFLLGFDDERALALAVDKSGKLVLQAKIWPDGSEIVHVNDVAASPKGSFAVTATSMSTGGAWSSFIE